MARHSNPFKLQRVQGFTLVELLVAVVIISILSAVAIPAYTDYVARAHITEATNALSELRTRAEQRFADTRTYAGASCTPSSVPKHFTVTCDTAANTYTLTATGTGVMVDYNYTVNQLNAKTSSTPTSSGACWITKKGGSC